MCICHHLPSIPVLHVVGFVFAHVLFLHDGLTELRNGIVIQRFPCAKNLMTDSDGSAHHAPIGNTIYPYLLRCFCQRCEEYLQVYHIALLCLDGKVLAISFWLGATDTVLCARLLIYETRLFRGQPHVGYLVGRHGEVAMQNSLIILGRQSPTHRHIGLLVLRQVDHLGEYLQYILLYRGILHFAIVLDPRIVRSVPFGCGLIRLRVFLYLRTRDKHTHAFCILLCSIRFRLECVLYCYLMGFKLCLRGETCHRQEAY